MALTQVSTGGIKDDAVTDAKLPANSVGNSEMKDDAVGVAELSASGTAGNTTYLRGDNTWTVPPDTNTTVGGATGVDFNDDVKIRFGTDNDLELYHTGSHGYILNKTGNLVIRAKDGETGIEVVPDGAVQLRYDNSTKLETTSTGVTVSGSDTTGTIVKGAFALRDVSSGSNRIEWIPGSPYGLRWGDNYKALFGSSDDLQIHHNGTNSFINKSTGELQFQCNDVRFYTDGAAETHAKFIHNGAVELYHNNIKTFNTSSTGIELRATEGGNCELYMYADEGDDNADLWRFIAAEGSSSFYLQNKNSGSWETNIIAKGDAEVQLNYNNALKFHTRSDGTQTTGICYADRFHVNDSEVISLGDGSDLQFHHTSGINYIDCWADLLIRNENSETMIDCNRNGSVELFNDGTKRLETFSGGCRIFGDLHLPTDGEYAYFGASDDLKIGHDGTNSFIENDTGELFISASQVNIKSAAGEYMAYFNDNGEAALYYDDVKKLHTYSEGIKVSGFVKAQRDLSDSHWGDNTHDWSHFHQDDNSQSIVVFESSANSTPYGIEVSFSDAQPDNNSQNFFAAYDHNGTDFTARAKIMSDGDVWTSDSGYLTSDETLKENITDATSKLEDLKKLKVRNFNWKSSYHPEKSKKKQLGFIAQEVEEVFPALITEFDIGRPTNEEGYTPVMKKGIKAAWDPIIIKAMQELIAKVETLETKVAALEAA